MEKVMDYVCALNLQAQGSTINELLRTMDAV
jgi:hypothetical protein